MQHNLSKSLSEHSLKAIKAHIRNLSASGLKRSFLLARHTLNNSTEHEGLRRSLLQLITVRVLILSTIFSTLLWSKSGEFGQLSANRTVFIVFAITYGVSLCNSIFLRNSKFPLRIGYLQFCIDVLLTTLAIYATSSLVMVSLYLITIVAAAFLLGRHGGVIIAAFSGICYAVLASGLVGSAKLSHVSAADILGVYTSLIVIALVSSYLARQFEIAGVKIARTERNLSEVSSQQQQLFEASSEGIITIDLSTTITGINEAARAIMGLADLPTHQLIGKQLNSAIKGEEYRPFLDLASSSSLATEHQAEISLQGPVDRGEVRLSCNIKAMHDHEGKQTGRIFRFSDVSHLRTIEERLTLHERMAELMSQTQASPSVDRSESKALLEMIGEGPALRTVKDLITKIAPSDASVLVSGESGTGKELIAKAIHEGSKRSRRPFIAINCGAIPENLIESELFGHKKGSFTGAFQDKVGLFQEADQGTIFLDEIGELPLHLQTKLLRVLQERTYRPVGDIRDIPVDVRVVAATNKDLKHEIANNKFRDDLYYRLNVVEISVPPLRERKEDIPLLVRHFMTRAISGQETTPTISPEALQILISHRFPGNIRELENIIHRALVLGGSVILPNHLPDNLIFGHSERGLTQPTAITRAPETQVLVFPIDLEGELEKLEKDYLLRALEESGGVKKEAAKLLGLNFRSLRYRLKKYGMQQEDELET